MSTPVLHVEHITMQFGGVVAVNDLSMDIYPGEIVALIGPNGAGKTTAFNCITGVYEPTNGRVDFMGEPIVCNHPRGKMKKSYAGAESERYLSLPTVSYTPDKITKRGIARTFQNIRLFKSMTVFENVLTAMHVRRTSNVFSATFRANRKEEAAQREKALELNTSPLKKGFPETNPGKAILKKYHDFGGRLVTVGSDAHTPEGVGFAFDRAAMLLKECGFTEYATFEKRQPVMHAL